MGHFIPLCGKIKPSSLYERESEQINCSACLVAMSDVEAYDRFNATQDGEILPQTDMDRLVEANRNLPVSDAAPTVLDGSEWESELSGDRELTPLTPELIKAAQQVAKGWKHYREVCEQDGFARASLNMAAKVLADLIGYTGTDFTVRREVMGIAAQHILARAAQNQADVDANTAPVEHCAGCGAKLGLDGVHYTDCRTVPYTRQPKAAHARHAAYVASIVVASNCAICGPRDEAACGSCYPADPDGSAKVVARRADAHSGATDGQCDICAETPCDGHTVEGLGSYEPDFRGLFRDMSEAHAALEAHKSEVCQATEYQYAGFPDEPGIASAHGAIHPFAEQWDGGKGFYDSMASLKPVVDSTPQATPMRGARKTKGSKGKRRNARW